MLGVLIAIALAMASQQQQPPPPQTQPVAFSHRQHAGTLGLACMSCHANPEPGDAMAYPAEAFCMGCHASIKTDSPDIKTLAALASANESVPWVRINPIPTYVFWSHKSHLASGASCGKCHGQVAAGRSLRRDMPRSMETCMSCHREEKASVDCSYCHESRH